MAAAATTLHLLVRSWRFLVHALTVIVGAGLPTAQTLVVLCGAGSVPRRPLPPAAVAAGGAVQLAAATDLVQLLSFWCLFPISLLVIEPAARLLLGWTGLFPELRLAAIFWLVSSNVKGARTVYESFICPAVYQLLKLAEVNGLDLRPWAELVQPPRDDIHPAAPTTAAAVVPPSSQAESVAAAAGQKAAAESAAAAADKETSARAPTPAVPSSAPVAMPSDESGGGSAAKLSKPAVPAASAADAAAAARQLDYSLPDNLFSSSDEDATAVTGAAAGTAAAEAARSPPPSTRSSPAEKALASHPLATPAADETAATVSSGGGAPVVDVDQQHHLMDAIRGEVEHVAAATVDADVVESSPGGGVQEQQQQQLGGGEMLLKKTQ